MDSSRWTVVECMLPLVQQFLLRLLVHRLPWCPCLPVARSPLSSHRIRVVPETLQTNSDEYFARLLKRMSLTFRSEV